MCHQYSFQISSDSLRCNFGVGKLELVVELEESLRERSRRFGGVTFDFPESPNLRRFEFFVQGDSTGRSSVSSLEMLDAVVGRGLDVDPRHPVWEKDLSKRSGLLLACILVLACQAVLLVIIGKRTMDKTG